MKQDWRLFYKAHPMSMYWWIENYVSSNIVFFSSEKFGYILYNISVPHPDLENFIGSLCIKIHVKKCAIH
jgi:hypothetical protein